jgi:2-dehydro-3-deoxyphosphooctonate aldolase (KDO 8-P synthase)
MEVAGHLRRVCSRLGVTFIFKASYDKANRTSGQSYRGPGMETGLEVLARVRRDLGVPVLTDIHTEQEAVAAGRVVDVLQIPAFLCRQTDLIAAAVGTGRVVNIKKGQFLAPGDMKLVVAKAERCGGKKLLLTERGTTFGYNNLVADMRSVPILRTLGYPVVFDATHSVQLPGGGGDRSGGQREFAPVLARSAVVAGADGVCLETHPDPDKAKSDGPNSVPLAGVGGVLKSLAELHGVARKWVGVAAFLAMTVLGWGQIPDTPVRGFSFQMVDQESLVLRGRVRGDVGQKAGENLVEVQGARFDSFGEGGVTNLIVRTDRCYLQTESRRLESGEALEVRSGDGRMELRGRGFSWDQAGGLVVSNAVSGRFIRGGGGEGAGVAERVLELSSDRLVYDRGQLRFLGGVVVREELDELECDGLTFVLRMAAGQDVPRVGSGDPEEVVERIQAEGQVKVVSSNLVAWAERAVYRLDNGQLALSGRPRWQSEGREGEAGEVLLDRVGQRLEAFGGVVMRLEEGSVDAVPVLSREVGVESASAGKPVEIRSDRLEVWRDDEVSGMVRGRFGGGVWLARGGNEMQCQVLEIAIREGGGQAAEGWVLDSAAALGGVRFVQGTNELRGVRADYRVEAGLLEVAGPVEWDVAGGRGGAERLRVDAGAGLSEAEGGVHMAMPAGRFAALDLSLGGEPDRSLDSGVGEIEAMVELTCAKFAFREAGEGREFGNAEFKGGVTVVRASDTRMTCDRLLAELEPATNSLHRMVALGGVRLATEDSRGRRVARGDRAEYLASEARLWLTGERGVELDLVDQAGEHRGRGGVAVYEVGQGVLALRDSAVLDSVHGRFEGDEVRVDRTEGVLSAGGRWKMFIPLQGDASKAISRLGEGGIK